MSDGLIPERRQPDERRRVRRGGRRIEDLGTHGDAHISPRQLADYLNIDRRLVMKFIEGGILTAYKFDTAWRINTKDAVMFVSRFQFKHRA